MIPTRREIALSPGGDLLVFSAATTAEPVETRLYRRPLDGDRAEPMAGTEGARQPFFCPDGRWIGFFSGGRLRKIPAAGGIPRDLGALPGLPAGASWTEDGRILLGNPGGALHWIPEEGGTPEPLTELDRTRESRQMLPRALPGGRGVLFTATPHSWGPEARIEVLTPSDGRRKTLLEDAADGHYVPSGHLVFIRRSRLMAVPFHLGRLEATGPAAPIRDHVRQALNFGNIVDHSAAGQFSASATGVLAYASGGIPYGYPRELIWVDRRGRVEVVEGFEEPFFSHPRLSPCGGYIAYIEQIESPADTRGGLWVFDRERRTRSLLRSRNSGYPVWSPDGKRLAIPWSEAGARSVWVVPAEGRGEARRLTESDRNQFPMSWSPDGGHLAIVEDNDILVYRFEDDSPAPFVATEAGEGQPVFSPDGRWLAYVSDETGRREVYVTSFPARDQRAVVSSGGGYWPIWSPSGSELFYRGPRHFMKVNLRYGDRILADAPTPLFDFSAMGIVGAGSYDHYAVDPGGERFLLARRKSPDPDAERAWAEPVTHLNLVTNWFEELKRLCPLE